MNLKMICNFYSKNIRILNLLLFVILYFMRRPVDVLSPSVWVEDGTLNIPQAISHGWASLLTPVQGYLIIPSKIITLVSLSISGIFYPEVAYLLTLTITIIILLLLTSDHVALEGKYFLPLIIALLPYDPEVFSTPLYIFWWTSLLLIIPIFSIPSHQVNSKIKIYVMTVTTVAVGCLSSPLCILLIPVMVFRAYIVRSLADYLALSIWTALSAYQFWLTSNSYGSSGILSKINFLESRFLIPKYFGNYLVYDDLFAKDTLPIYIIFTIIMGIGVRSIYCTIRDKDINLFYISASFVMTILAIASSWIRVGLAPDPIFAGPRYFFFPYIFLSLFLLSIISFTKSSAIRVICMSVIILSCTLTWIKDFSYFFRISDPLSWRSELAACLTSPEPYRLKIQSNGVRSEAWHREYTYSECSLIVESGILAHVYSLDKSFILKNYQQGAD